MALSCSQKSAELRWITSEHYGEFYFLNCFHSFRTKIKIQSQKKGCKNKDSSSIIMPSEYSKILEFNQYQIPDKALFFIYALFIHHIQKCLQYLCLET